VVMMHMSRFCEDMIIWSSNEFHYIEISDAFTTGSSIMPQKKNPDVAELIRGKTGRVYGHLMAMLTILKGLPMTYNRDLQEDKEPLFDAVDTVSSSVDILTGMLPQITFQRERMKAEAGKDFSTATDIAEYLVQKGIPFREAHGIVGRIVEYCLDNKKELTALRLAEFLTFHSCFDEDVIPRLQPAISVNMRKTIGGTALVMVEERIRDIEKGS
ncbi:MAG: argininosuccinate lyase, partial [Syntrophus sp. (in: bacteria)]